MISLESSITDITTFPASEHLSGTQKIFILPSNILVCWSFAKDIVVDPDNGNVKGINHHERGGFYYFQDDGELFIRMADSCSWYNKKGSLITPVKNFMFCLAGRNKKLYAWGSLANHGEGFFEIDRDRLLHLRTFQDGLTDKERPCYLIINRDGTKIVSQSFINSEDYFLDCWDIESGARMFRLEGPTWGEEGVFAIGNNVIATRADGGFRIWSLESGKLISTLPDDIKPLAAMFSKSEKFMYIATKTGLKIWDVAKNEMAAYYDVAGPISAAGIRGDSFWNLHEINEEKKLQHVNLSMLKDYL